MLLKVNSILKYTSLSSFASPKALRGLRAVLPVGLLKDKLYTCRSPLHIIWNHTLGNCSYFDDTINIRISMDC